jgi:predicted negative regulator of RcsB-dependent stress response
MENYSTEEQQVEAIKSFWKENGVAIVIGAVVGLGSMVGWRMYSDANLSAQEADSEKYSAVADTSAPELGKLKAYIEETDGSYAVLAAFSAARLAVEQNDLAEAKVQLTWVQDNTSHSALKDTAALRLARVHYQANENEQALQALELVTDGAMTAAVNEVKGDIHVRLGNLEQAQTAYQLALDADSSNRYLQMKLDNLSQVTKV